MLLASTLRRAAIAAAILAAAASRAAADDKETCISASERGQALAREHKLVAAREQFVACARDVCPGPILKDCAAQLARAEQGIATVVLVAQDEGGVSMTHARVAMDGAPLATELDGKAVVVDPGMHLFHFEAAGHPPVEQEVIVEEGARLKRVAVTFAAPASRATTPPRTRAPIPAAAWITGGIAVVALGGFAGFGIAGLVQSNDLHSRNPTQYTSADVTSLRTKLAIADICLGAGVLATGFTVWLVLSRPAQPQASGSTVGIGPSSDGVRAAWRVTF